MKKTDYRRTQRQGKRQVDGKSQQRDNGICVQCGKVVGLRGHVDHIVPLPSGGTNALDNLQTLCASCHSIKTSREDGGYGRDKKRT